MPDQENAIVAAREPAHTQQVDLDLKITEEHLVKRAKFQYTRKIMEREEEANKAIAELEKAQSAAAKAIDDHQSKVAPDHYEEQVKELFAALKSFGIAKPKIEVKVTLRLEDDTNSSGYYHGNTWREAKTTKQKPVGVVVSASWDGGEISHRFARKLTKHEREMLDTQKDINNQIDAAKKVLFQLDKAKSEYAMVADYVDGALAEEKIKRVAPKLLDVVSIDIPEFKLPEVAKPKLKALPAPKKTKKNK